MEANDPEIRLFPLDNAKESNYTVTYMFMEGIPGFCLDCPSPSSTWMDANGMGAPASAGVSADMAFYIALPAWGLSYAALPYQAVKKAASPPGDASSRSTAIRKARNTAFYERCFLWLSLPRDDDSAFSTDCRWSRKRPIWAKTADRGLPAAFYTAAPPA